MEERLYDLIFICMPATPEEEITRLIGVLEQAVADKGAKLEKIEKWGARKMAYRVSKQREGYYVYMALRSAQGEIIKELERRLRVADPVIKYMTVRLDEEIKRQQKLVGRRDRRAKRRPRKTAGTSAPAPGVQAPGTVAGAPAAVPASAPGAPGAALGEPGIPTS
jgi:small subunit ribosomal protein S6